ncbi:MAG: winged helix-turn-helix transcriptional regulator [Planctomycetes bacterium]|nr:winged helix-turn-helix transcriptional regulator [Planctomycetota bacterium]
MPIPLAVLERVSAALRVLAHPHRLKAVELLCDHELSVGELAERMKLSPAACSQHLNLMRAHGLLKASRRGRVVYYEVCNSSARNVIECIRTHEIRN